MQAPISQIILRSFEFSICVWPCCGSPVVYASPYMISLIHSLPAIAFSPHHAKVATSVSLITQIFIIQSCVYDLIPTPPLTSPFYSTGCCSLSAHAPSLYFALASFVVLATFRLKKRRVYMYGYNFIDTLVYHTLFTSMRRVGVLAHVSEFVLL